jgi:nucleotide-binding universal stress UspA family protein
MNKRMRILIGYDGSECAAAALDELKRAGLPDVADAVVMSVAEHWLMPFPIQETSQVWAAESIEDLMGEARATSSEASERLRALFPGWRIDIQTEIGSPATVLLEKADVWRPDLIAVGSHGRSAAGRLILGSVSQKLAIEARCSVHIGRGQVIDKTRPIRVLIGLDGSAGAEEAVRGVAARAWPEKTEVRLITLVGTHFNVDRARGVMAYAREIQDVRGSDLSKIGLVVSHRTDAGDPREEIPREAHAWGADCIFVGARGLSPVKRFLLGSVSSAVASRAHCSVEIVRPHHVE